MTDLSGLAQAVGVLRAAYPRQDFPDETVALYVEMLGDLPDGEVVDAVKRLVKRSTFLPSVAEIRREVAEAALRLPTPAEAWRMVNDAATQNLLPLEVAEAMRDVGGRYAIRTSEQPSVIRSQFLKLYESRREQALLEEMVTATGKQLETVEVGIIGRSETLRLVPPTESMPPSPLAKRAWEMADVTMPPPTDEEKADAIRVLKLGEPAEGDHLGRLVWIEAHRIIDDETRRAPCGHDGWVAGCAHCEVEQAMAKAWIDRAEKS